MVSLWRLTRRMLDALRRHARALGATTATLVLLAPLGVVLGLFMPLGLRVVALLGAEGPTYVAWAWAVNGFCSVIGSVLTAMLSMTFGFRAVLVLGLVAYVVALTALWRLSAPAAADTVVPG